MKDMRWRLGSRISEQRALARIVVGGMGNAGGAPREQYNKQQSTIQQSTIQQIKWRRAEARATTFG